MRDFALPPVLYDSVRMHITHKSTVHDANPALSDLTTSCGFCGATMDLTRPWGKYCNAKCRVGAWKRAHPEINMTKRPGKEIVAWVMRYLAKKGNRKRAKARRALSANAEHVAKQKAVKSADQKTTKPR